MPISSVSCPICDRDDWVGDATASRLLGLPQAYAVVRCRQCAQRRLDPQLSSQEIDELYGGAYFTSAESVSPEFSGIKASPVDYGTETTAEREFKFAKTLETLKRLGGGAGSLLDIGAATGDFVKIARERGFDAAGIETSSFAVAQARTTKGIDLQCMKLSQLQGDEVYDCIHLNHVFEHFNEPVVEIEHIRRLLKVGGLLYVEVPFQFNFLERLRFYLSRPNTDFTLHSLHHAYFYTPRTLSKLLEGHRFRIEELSVFDAERYFASGGVGTLKTTVWQTLAKMSIGNHIEAYARRTS